LAIAHGQGAVEEDRVEHRALAGLLSNAPRARVLALKGYWGYQGAASGVFELIAGLLAAKHRQTPRSLNFTHPDADAPPLAIVAEPSPFPDAPFATVAYGVGGQCAAVVVRPVVG
jgi:3-oxoacyl-(acyl-carrier-protein) synthase